MKRRVRGIGVAAAIRAIGAFGAIGATCAASGACRRAPPGLDGLSRPEAARRAADLRTLGARLFADETLSASGRLACASCHRPDRAFGPPDGRAVQPGGATDRAMGIRAVPSLRYLQAVPPFSRHTFASSDEADDSVDQGPAGGLTWDGRVDRGRDQARIPLRSPFEMANADDAAIVARLLASASADDVRRLAAESRRVPLDVALDAIEAYEESPAVFAPYSSRYDAVLRGNAKLTPLEARGLEVFNDPAKGNCASCHPSRLDRNGVPPAFSDYGFVAIGVPRNTGIPANADPGQVDLGLCGPLRTDLTAIAAYCGRFRTPSLRNVATRAVFFHNGVVHRLRDAVAFYATRDSDPGRWFGREANGAPRRSTDLPDVYRGNLETGAPFGRAEGGRARLTDADVDAIVAFLETLTDADATNIPSGS